MGIFPNYEKAGAGIDKNAPKKRGIFLYFELIGRYLWKFIKANMLYTAISIPVLMVYHYLFLCVFGTIYGADAELSLVNHSALTFTVLLAIFWGTGPVSCGFTHLLRGMAREEHIWVSLDFFDKSKESFKHGLVFLIVDLLVFVVSMTSISVYSSYVESKSNVFIIPMVIIITGLVIYTGMHFFMYELEVTFENKLKEIYKNSLLMTIATFPMLFLIAGIICLLSYFIFGILPSAGIIIVGFLFWVGLMRFIIDFYSARYIKRHFLKEAKESEK